MTTRANILLKIAAALVVALFLALVPLGLQNSGQLQQSQAYADVEPSGEMGMKLLEQYADAAGMSSSDFVVTCLLGFEAATGKRLVRELGPDGMAAGFGRTVGENLSTIVENVDYPDWDTLTDEQKQRWSNKQENYDAAKFNELMLGFGMDGVNQSYYEGFSGNVGHKIDLDQEQARKLTQIGRIGSLWFNGVGTQLSTLVGLVSDSDVITNFPIADQEGTINYTPSEDYADEWPSDVPKDVLVGFGNTLRFSTSQYWYLTNPETFFMVFRVPDSGSTSWRTVSMCFSRSAFIRYEYKNEDYWSQLSSSQVTITPYDSYHFITTNTTYTAGYTCTQPINEVATLPSANSSLRKVAAIMLDDGINYGSGGSDDVPGYPEHPSGNVIVYMPVSGIGGDTTYDDMTTNPDLPVDDIPRPDNPYNPGNQTGGNPWVKDTTSNLLPLTGINFDQLFPFSMLADIPLLFNKVQQLAPGGSGDYSRITIPLHWGQDENSSLVLDLTWLHDLLVMTRPAVLVLLVAALLWVTVEFWKSILTG